MTDKKEASASVAAPTDADPKDQLHSTTSGAEIQALCGKISDELFDEVRFPLRMAMVAVNDNGNEYFKFEDLDTSTDIGLVLYGFKYAEVRNNTAMMNINNALEALEKIIERLDQIGGRVGES
jgi:hypothetical protein